MGLSTKELLALRNARTLEEVQEITNYLSDDWQGNDYDEIPEWEDDNEKE